MSETDSKPEQCPQCRSLSEVTPYVREAGIAMFACGRCFIHWRVNSVATGAVTPQATQRCSCNVSTGICGCTTFGTGKLDDNGFWQFPCKHGSGIHTCSAPAEPEGATPTPENQWREALTIAHNNLAEIWAQARAALGQIELVQMRLAKDEAGEPEGAETAPITVDQFMAKYTSTADYPWSKEEVCYFAVAYLKEVLRGRQG